MFERLQRRRNLLKKRFSRHADEYSEAKSSSQREYSQYSLAHNVYKKASESLSSRISDIGRETRLGFGETGVGSELRSLIGEEGFGQFNPGTASILRNIQDDPGSGGIYQRLKRAGALPGGRTPGQGKYELSKRYQYGYLRKFDHGKWKSREIGPSWARVTVSYWDPTHMEDISQRFARDLRNTAAEQYRSVGGLEETINKASFLGSKKAVEIASRAGMTPGKRAFTESGAYKTFLGEYTAGMESDVTRGLQESLETAKSESERELAEYKESEGMFTAASKQMSKTKAELDALTGRVRKFERLGLGKKLISKRYKPAKVGAGSYIS